MKSYLAVLAAILTGCAAAPARKNADSCTETPQWTAPGAHGEMLGIFVCFGADQSLSYKVRVLPPPPPPPPAPPTAEKILEAKRAAGRAMATGKAP